MSKLNRRTFLTIGTAVGGAALLSWPQRAHGAITHHLVRNGEPAAVVVLPDDADPQVTWAAEELIRLVRKATGATLPTHIGPGVAADGLTRLYLGHAGEDSLPTLSRVQATLDPDGFVIAPHRDTVTVLGPTPWGTRHGILELVESALDYTALLPTERGEYLPAAATVGIGPRRTTQNPTYTSRALHPSPTAFEADWTPRGANVVKAWGDNNRTHWRINFHHHEWRMFDSALFGDPDKPESYHPEWYPIRNGATYIPPAGLNKGWHIRYTADGVAAEAARQIIEFFDENPTASSFSLGVSDGPGFSEDEMDDSVNGVGMTNMSPVYYAWVNDVTERVMQQRPEFSDRLIGLLAYNWVNDPPPFKLHPNVVPFLTRDRYVWVDPVKRAEDQAHTAAWGEVATQLGWYDYVYGFPYAIPRVTFDLLDEVVSWGAEHGVVGQMSEMRYNWGEGPKPWAYAKKLWNADRSMADLVSEWCRKAVGNGGPQLEAYFRHWERIWMEKVPDSTWFHGSRNHTYCRFDDLSYLDVVTPEDVSTAEQLLESATNGAQTDDEIARVTMIGREFALTKASALSYPRDLPAPDSATSATALLDDTLAELDASVAHAQSRDTLFAAMQSDELHKQARSPMSYGALWSGWNCKTMIKIADWARANVEESASLRAHVSDLAETAESSEVRGYCRHLLLMINDEVTRYGVNTGFEDGDLTGWSINPNQPPLAPPAASTEVTHSGNYSLKLTGGFHSCPLIQTNPTFAAGGGVWVTRFKYFVPEGSKATGVFVPGIRVTDIFGADIGYRHDHYIPMTASQGEWVEALFVDKLPATTKEVRASSAVATLGAEGVVYIDDVEYLYYGSVSDGTIPDSITVQQDQFTLDPANAEIMADPDATDGFAARLRGNRQSTGVQLDLGQLSITGTWQVYARIRVEVQPDTNMAGWGVVIGTTDDEIRELFRLTPFADGGYQHIALTQPLTLSGEVRHLYVSGINRAVDWIHVDCLELVPV
ncbi:DUF4838 domain-containing protein [Microlunatus sp. Y2014]|uniref:DUF4838 domain-containing protein n=1 Tax=Microlunatus sp. Y2014 TaxID=3418488 RepID=UPI003DA6E0E4